MPYPAGWYSDQSGTTRWWDGSQWTERTQEEPSSTPGRARAAFGALSTSLKGVVAERKQAKEDAARRLAEQRAAAGRLLTSGSFGSVEVEIYENGYVRVADREVRPPQTPGKINDHTPFEELISITFIPPHSHTEKNSSLGLDSSTLQLASSLLKGSSALMKTSVIGAAVTTASHVTKSMTGESVLTIATDHKIHILTNRSPGTLGKVAHKEEGVGQTLEQVGNMMLQRLGRSTAPVAPSNAEPTGVSAVTGTGAMHHPVPPPHESLPSPTLTDRLRELSALHEEGILDDAEFAAAKAALLKQL